MKTKAVLEKMTLEEKAALCGGGGFWNTLALPALGVPGLTLTDGPHGVRKQSGQADHLGVNESDKTTKHFAVNNQETRVKEFTLNMEAPGKPLNHPWELCVGSCHAATALRADWQAQMRKTHEELGFEYVRFHGLFDDDMSVARRPIPSPGVPLKLCFTNIDVVFDFLLSINMKPFVELGFMPEAPAFHGGHGLLTQHGIPKAPYRAFQVLRQLGGRLELFGNFSFRTTSAENRKMRSVLRDLFGNQPGCRTSPLYTPLNDGTVDVYPVYKERTNVLHLLVVNHNSLLHEIEDAEARITLPGGVTIHGADVQRIDDSHANALTAWRGMGQPEYLDAARKASLLAASELRRENLDVTDGVVLLTVPAQGIALVSLYL